MTDQQLLTGARVFDGDAFRDGVALLLSGGRIADIVSDDAAISGVEPVELDGGTLAPGFVDLQVNGGGGVLFNNAPSVDALERMVAAHRRVGTTAICPTFISDEPARQRQAGDAVLAALDVSGVLGVHFEGPHLAADKRGAHQSCHFRDMRDSDVEYLLQLARSLLVIVTLAPERVSPSLIGRLAAGGVVVCGGHSAADFDTVTKAVSAGMRGFTHLYNAMSAFGVREPGMVGAALTADECWCGIIADGHHVHATALQLAHRTKPPGKLYLVSDAMATAGSAQQSFELYGETIEDRGGSLRNREGRLAGSAITLIDAVRICHRDFGIPLDECLRMASLYPATLAGTEETRGRLLPGFRADIVHFSKDFSVTDTWVAGQRNVSEGGSR